MSQEPEYLQRLRRAQAAKDRKAGKGLPQPGGAAGQSYSPQEQEALRWARGIAAGQELRSIRNLGGARFAVLLRLQSASGTRFLSVEGLPTREALKERVKPGATVGEEVLGAYEVRRAHPEDDGARFDENLHRPAAPHLIGAQNLFPDRGAVVLRMGAPRPGANPVDPERMLRKAAADAIIREKTRPKGGGRDRR